MNSQTWARRLAKQLPGWHVWHASLAGWYAVPAPAGTELAVAVLMENQIGPYRLPQQLREECCACYGWGDDCESCGIPAWKCGHRRPEGKP